MLEAEEELACLCASSEVKSQNRGLIPSNASADAVTPTVSFQLVRVRHTESPPSFRSYIN
jgi:hypothetical protein